MKQLMALLIALCMLFGICSVSASAVTADGRDVTGRRVYFADDGRFGNAYIYCWDEDVEEYYEWPGVQMEKCGANDNGDDLYMFELPENTDGYIIHDNNCQQTIDIYFTGSVMISLQDEQDDYGHYYVNISSIVGDDPYQPQTPVAATTFVALAQYSATCLGGSSDQPVYLYCCSEDDSHATLYAQMEYFGTDDYGMDRYRFTVPAGMTPCYFTDGTKRSVDLAFSSVDLYTMIGDCDENGNLVVNYVTWADGPDGAHLYGPSLTTFDNFCGVYGYSPEDNPCYRELYTHCDSNGDVDWVLFYVESNGDTGMLAMYKDVIGNRVVDHGAYFDVPFPSYYGLYDAKNDSFVEVNSDTVNDYDGLAKVFDEVGEGRFLGDIDGDDSVTVIDATIIQRCEAMMSDYPEDDELGIRYHDRVLWYYSDFNRDGERDIVDATCIQRYLAGLAYPVS